MVVSNEAKRHIAKQIVVESSSMNAQQETTYRQQIGFNKSGGTGIGGTGIGRGQTNGSQRPYCTYCEFNGHVKEKCYKLHGYPPGHRLHKGKNNGSVNNVTTDKSASNHFQTSSVSHTDSSNPFTAEQVTHIWNMIKQQNLGTAKTGEGQCHMAGICNLVLNSFAKHCWIIDSGATDFHL
ncbi:hypothetical protein QQ045_020456 [Rhodiola kirilowii]